MNKKTSLILMIILTVFTFTFIECTPQTKKNPWTKDQLMQPAKLAAIMKDSTQKQPLILNIGFTGGIKNSINIGPASRKANYDKLKQELQTLHKDANIVIYCGCCPFSHCPNIRPAFRLLNKMHFTNAKLLNLSTSLKADWINKGYPVTDN